MIIEEAKLKDLWQTEYNICNYYNTQGLTSTIYKNFLKIKWKIPQPHRKNALDVWIGSSVRKIQITLQQWKDVQLLS